MVKILLICLFSFSLWGSPSFGQTGENGAFTNVKQTFVENNLRHANNPIEFFPNPSQDFLYVKVNDISLQKVEFEIYNIIGNSMKIEVEEIEKDFYKIPVSSLSQGYYLLVVQDKENRFKQAYKFQKK